MLGMRGAVLFGAAVVAALGLSVPVAAAQPPGAVVASGGGGGAIDTPVGAVPTHFGFVLRANGTGEFECIVSGQVPAGSPMPAGMPIRGPVVGGSVTGGVIVLHVDSNVGPATVTIDTVAGTLDVDLLAAMGLPPEWILSGSITIH